MVNPQTVVVHSPPGVSLSETSSDLSSTITVTLAAPEDNAAPGMPLEVTATAAVCHVDPKDSPAPPLPPREPSSDSVDQDLVDNRKSRKSKEPVVSDEERLRHLEELDIKQALELSKVSATNPMDESSSIDDLKLTPEELRFVMDGFEPTSTAKATSSIKEAHSRESSISDQSIVAPKVTAAPRIVRNPQMTEVESNKVSQQGPRPWIPEEETADSATKEVTKDTPATPAPEELASASSVIETMGETLLNTSKKTSTTSKKIPESMGSEPERLLESMGSEPAVLLESMGSEGHEEAIPAFVPMPRMPSMDGIRAQKILMNQQLQQVQQQLGPSASPELQYLEVQNSPLVPNSNLQGQTSHLASPSLAPGYKIATNAYQTSTTYQPTTSYQPSTKYVPQPSKQKSRLSGIPQLHQQQQYQMQHQLYQQQQQQQFQQQPYQNSGNYSAQYYQQQHQQLQDFYYTPYEQQSNPSSNFGWNVPGGDDTYKEESYSQYGDTSPSPSHISLIPDNSASPLMTPSDKTHHDSAYKVELR